MKYLVMECGLGYAIVLDGEGRFLRVPNLGYEVGQTVENVILFPEAEAEEAPKQKSFFQRNIRRLTTAAACFCLVVIGTHQFLFTTYGTVRMQINPDVLLSVNRLNYVTDVDGLNKDGTDLIDDYDSFGKKVDIVSDELSALAMEKGYLTDGGNIHITVESEHEDWKRATEEMLIAEISLHVPESITVQTTAPKPPKTEITIPFSPDDDDRDDDFDDDWDDDTYDDTDDFYDDDIDDDLNSTFHDDSDDDWNDDSSADSNDDDDDSDNDQDDDDDDDDDD